MRFKQIIRLISMGLIFVILSSMMVIVLPEKYTTDSRTDVTVINLEGFKPNWSLEGFSRWTKKTLSSAGKRLDLDLDLDGLLGGVTDSESLQGVDNDQIQELDLNLATYDLTTYYKSASGKTGQALKVALNDIIDNHEELSYKEVWDALKVIDEDPLNENNVILIYTGKSVPKSSNGTGRDDWNREHVWAKSHGDFGTRLGAGTDLHHIKPADVTVNSSRNNKNFDDSDGPHHEALLCRHDSDSFEPRDSVKGDVSRMIFYMAVRYEGEHGDPDLELVEYMNETKSPHHGKLSTLLLWHKEDPVSDFERRRNNLIYEKYQGNRNPFIDHPEWVEEIWGQAS
ncbi:endonuclease I family protein [Fusibacter sp. JL216-2]|uniref:endonuclease I family protein n=1 Tax=Fusibacter sp. JL216-2 TaxID=3071453 RepID=UPI003D3442CC